MLNFGWAYAQRKCCVKFGWASEWTDLHVGFKVTEEKGGLLDKTLWYAALLYLTCFPTWEGRYRDKERGGLSITLSRGLTASRRWGLSTRRDERRENKIERLGKAHYAARRVVFALSLTTLTSKQLFFKFSDACESRYIIIVCCWTSFTWKYHVALWSHQKLQKLQQQEQNTNKQTKMHQLSFCTNNSIIEKTEEI